MIVLDIETSGLQFKKNGIWQIGAIDLESDRKFIEECRIDEDEEIDLKALEITGKTKDYIRDNSKQSQKQILENFFNWIKKSKFKNCLCQNPQFDLGFIFYKSEKYKLSNPIPYRAFDLHSIAQIEYFKINKSFLTDEKRIKSEMSLQNILKFCGINYERKFHDALEDCKLTGECFYRIVYKKMKFEEFKKYPIPKYLKNDNL